MNLDLALRLAEESNSLLVCLYDNTTRSLIESKYSPRKNFKGIFLDCTGKPEHYLHKVMYEIHDSHVQSSINKINETYGPEKILFFNEFYLYKYFNDIPAKKVYFVRNLSKGLVETIHKHLDDDAILNDILFSENPRNIQEVENIKSADLHVCDSNFSSKKLQEFYNINATVIEGHPNYTIFKAVRDPDYDIKQAYYIGRQDWQKGLHQLNLPKTFALHLVGSNIVERAPSSIQNENVFHHGELSFNEYIPIVEKIPFALFPQVWESNGLAIKEALAMGKIVIANIESGGCLEHIKHEQNGFIIDFANTNWETYLDHITHNFNLKEISRNARQTFHRKDYEDSILAMTDFFKNVQ